MIIVNEDNSIYLTRGDDVVFDVAAVIDNAPVTFRQGESIHFKVYEKKNCDNVVLDKRIAVSADTETVQIQLSDEETKLGTTINKPIDYWYEIEHIDRDGRVQTILGYDENGAKIFRLFPEGII